MTIELTEYSESWKKAFELEQKSLLYTFQDHVKAIEHVGSTSIRGLMAKPVIDIFMAVFPFHSTSYYQQALAGNHYRHTPTDMIGRHLFAKYSAANNWTHNLHIMPFDNDFYMRNEILFRDYLKKQPELVLEYNDLKRCLALKQYASLEGYTQAKTDFIQKVVDRARLEKGLPRQNVWTMEYIKEA